MNDGIFDTDSGQKKALGNEGDGTFDTNSGARKATGGALAKVDNGKGSALAQMVQEGAGKLARVIAEGKDIQMDAQRVMYFLASFGEGNQLGRFVFTSPELVGREAFERDIRDVTYEPDPEGPKDQDGRPIGSGIPKETIRKVPVDAVPPSQDGQRLDMTGVRLRDAVHILRERGWVETTDDGEFGTHCDFATVKLTAKGRDLALTAVKKMGLKQGVDFAEGFGGMPDLFDLGGGFGAAPQLTELQQQQQMLSRAKVAFKVEHEGEGDDARTTIVINDKPAFVFDTKGALVNSTKDAKASDAKATDAKASDASDATKAAKA